MVNFNKNRFGFSLVELLVSLAVMLVLVLLVMPSLRSDGEGNGPDSPIYTMKMDLLSLQNRAINGELIPDPQVNFIPIGYIFRTTASGYILEYVPDITYPGAISNLIIKRQDLPGYSIDPVDCYITFDIYDQIPSHTNCIVPMPDPDGISVTITSQQGRTEGVRVNLLTGKIKVE